MTIGAVGSGVYNGSAPAGSAARVDTTDTGGECDPKLIQACREFEAIFIETILKSARAGLPKDGLFSSHEQEVVRGMLDAELARALAQGRGIGLAEFIKKDVVGNRRQVSANAAR